MNYLNMQKSQITMELDSLGCGYCAMSVHAKLTMLSKCYEDRGNDFWNIGILNCFSWQLAILTEFLKESQELNLFTSSPQLMTTVGTRNSTVEFKVKIKAKLSSPHDCLGKESQSLHCQLCLLSNITGS